MSTLIQTTQTNVPVVLMYRLIHLTGADESAPALRDALKKQLEEDQIYDLVKANLVGLITDGAPSMIGEFTGFIQIVIYSFHATQFFLHYALFKLISKHFHQRP